MTQSNQVTMDARSSEETVQEFLNEHVWGTLSALRSAMVINEGIDSETVKELVLESKTTPYQGVINYHGVIVGAFKWFEGLDEPCFRWQGEEFGKHSRHKKVVVDGVERIKFRPSLSYHDTVGLIVEGKFATPELHQFLMGMLTNYMDDPRYEIHRKANAFFQGGSNDPDGGWFYVEFWNPAGVEAFINYVNEHYNPSDESYKDFL